MISGKLLSRQLTATAGLTFAMALGTTAYGVAQAQTSVPPPSSNQTIPEKDPATSQKLQQEQGAPGVQNGRSGSLSSKLNQSDGVIAPKAGVDPGMRVPAPAGASTAVTPVIPPAATGGANAK